MAGQSAHVSSRCSEIVASEYIVGTCAVRGGKVLVCTVHTHEDRECSSLWTRQNHSHELRICLSQAQVTIAAMCTIAQGGTFFGSIIAACTFQISPGCSIIGSQQTVVAKNVLS
jgi:hypothetical protein